MKENLGDSGEFLAGNAVLVPLASLAGTDLCQYQGDSVGKSRGGGE
jgi:hypothetical protein